MILSIFQAVINYFDIDMNVCFCMPLYNDHGSTLIFNINFLVMLFIFSSFAVGSKITLFIVSISVRRRWTAYCEFQRQYSLLKAHLAAIV